MNYDNLTMTVFTLLNDDNSINQTINKQPELPTEIWMVFLIPMLLAAITSPCAYRLYQYNHVSEQPSTTNHGLIAGFERQLAHENNEECKAPPAFVL